MRNAVSLARDVLRLLREEMRRSGSSLQRALNHFARLGQTSAGKLRDKPFAVVPGGLGLPPGLSYDSVAELLENLEEVGQS